MATRKLRLVKTSVQLPEDVMTRMDAWPGLTRSEAIRLAVERAYYYASLNSEETANLFNNYRPILDGALEDFDYSEFRTVARALPAIVQGFIAENSDADWKNPYDDRSSLEPMELVGKLKALSPFERIGILDCVVARRGDDDVKPTTPKRRRKTKLV